MLEIKNKSQIDYPRGFVQSVQFVFEKVTFNNLTY